MSTSPTKVSAAAVQSFLAPLFRERFVHHHSQKTYDAIFSLWHLSPNAERLLSRLVSKWLIGQFCLEYLAHYQDLLSGSAGLEEKFTAVDLADEEKIRALTKKLHPQKPFKDLLEDHVLPALHTILEHGEAQSLLHLTQLAHAGDYLLSALEDLRKNKDPEYTLWLESVPSYYERDLSSMGSLKAHTRSRRIPLDSWITNLDQHLPFCETASPDGGSFTIKSCRRERRRAVLGINRWTTESPSETPC